MNGDKQREEFLRLLGSIWLLTGRTTAIPAEILRIYDDALAPFGYAKLIPVAMDLFLNRKASDPFPAVSTFRDRIVPPPASDDSEAQAMVARINQAVEIFGYAQPSKARAFVGDLAWRALAVFGSWENYCTEESDPGVRRAQLRASCEAVIERARLGVTSSAPAIPAAVADRLAAPKPLSEILGSNPLLPSPD